MGWSGIGGMHAMVRGWGGANTVRTFPYTPPEGTWDTSNNTPTPQASQSRVFPSTPSTERDAELASEAAALFAASPVCESSNVTVFDSLGRAQRRRVGGWIVSFFLSLCSLSPALFHPLGNGVYQNLCLRLGLTLRLRRHQRRRSSGRRRRRARRARRGWAECRSRFGRWGG